MSDINCLSTIKSDVLAKIDICFDSDVKEKTYTEDELNIIRQAYDLLENSISFSERFNKYLKDREQGGIVNDVQIKPLINQKVMDTESYGFTQGFTVTVDPMPLKGYAKFPNLSPKSKFKPGDKVKIINDFIMDIKRESVNFKGFEGFINDVIFNSVTFEYDYTIAVNGITTSKINESALELISLPAIEYRKDLYDIADDIDGCLLPDCRHKTELIQRKIS